MMGIQEATRFFVCLLVGCQMSQQHASLSQGRICSSKYTSTKMECDYLYGWIKKPSHTQKSHQSGEPQRYSWGTQKKKKTSVCAATQRQKLHIKFSISPSLSTPTLGQPVPVLTLYCQQSGRVATGVSVLKSLV